MIELERCPVCGYEGAVLPETPEESEIITEASVRIAEIEAKRDVDLAKINAGIMREEIQVEAQVASAEKDILEDVVEDLTAPEENVTIITSEDSDLDGEEIPDEEMAEAPPEVDIPEAPARKSNWSYWG